MIKNERQYKATLAQIRVFEGALSEVGLKDESSSLHSILQKAQRESLLSQVAGLQEALQQYEALSFGDFDFARLEHAIELPQLLIEARIASGLSQKDLAGRLKLKEQQIQRYEATNYGTASLNRIQQIIDAISTKPSRSKLPDISTLSAITLRASRLGLPKEFALRRLVPTRNRTNGSDEKEQTAAIRIASARLARMFRMPLGDIFKAEKMVSLEPAAAKFKKAINANQKKLQAYTHYAYSLAEICSRMGIKAKHELLSDSKYIRRRLVTSDEGLTLGAIAQLLWDSGVPVLGLDDPGAFHGACFRIGGRNVVVVKQKTKSSARWMFDLLHEYWHACQEPTKAKRTVVESTDIDGHTDEEEDANQFAVEVLLGRRHHEIVNMCIEAADGEIGYLKDAVIRVAQNEDIPIGILANHVAHIAGAQGFNWWAAANSLQIDGEEPSDVIRNTFFANCDLSRLDDFEREFLVDAISPWDEEEDG